MLIAAGGSGGHVFPAQALAEELIEQGYEIQFIGGGLAANPYFKGLGAPAESIPCADMSGKDLFHLFEGGAKILGGAVKSYRLIRKYRPDLVVGFGSYHTFPVLLGARLYGAPIILHEGNSVPGKVNRLLSPYVLKTAIHFPSSKEQLKGRSCHAALPLRKPLRDKTLSREAALNYFSLENDWPTLLVFGGSQGALELNKIVSESIIDYVRNQGIKFQILHFTGEGKLSEEIAASYKRFGIPHVVKPFEERMECAWKLADLAITRAGACSLAEQTEFAVPGILVPYPYATDNHQEKNADAFIESTRGAMKFLEKDLNPAKLALVLCGLFKDPAKLKVMSKNIAAYRDSAERRTLAQLVYQTINQP